MARSRRRRSNLCLRQGLLPLRFALGFGSRARNDILAQVRKSESYLIPVPKHLLLEQHQCRNNRQLPERLKCHLPRSLVCFRLFL